MEKSTLQAESDVNERKLDLVIDTKNLGLMAFLPEYTSKILLALWSAESDPKFKGASSREAFVWYNEYANDHGLDTRSRAAVIVELNDLCDRGILEFEKETCKGGSRRLYKPLISPSEFEERARTELEEALDLTIFSPGWWVQEGRPISP